VIFNRAADAGGIVTQNIYVRRGLGREPQQAENHQHPEWEKLMVFSCLWVHRHCLHRYFLLRNSVNDLAFNISQTFHKHFRKLPGLEYGHKSKQRRNYL